MIKQSTIKHRTTANMRRPHRFGLESVDFNCCLVAVSDIENGALGTVASVRIEMDDGDFGGQSQVYLSRKANSGLGTLMMRTISAAALMLGLCGCGALNSSDDARKAYNEGVMAQQAGRMEEAIDHYTNAIDQNAKYMKAYFNRGIISAESGDYEAAVKDFERAVELDPEHAMGYSNRGHCYVQLGQTDLALIDFDRAIELDSNCVHAYCNRAALYLSQGEQEKAAADHARAVQLDPSLQ